MNTQTARIIPSGRTPLMSLRHISKYFGGVQALMDVDMDIHRGEVIVLVGDNGAGKSTFLKVISGVNIPEEGEIEFNGRTVTIRNTLDSVELGIQTVYQDLALCDNLDIVQNLFLGRELTARGRLNEAEMERVARECLGELGIEVQSVRAKANALSGGQRQALTLLMATIVPPKLLLLDEHTAALDPGTAEKVLELTREITSRERITCLMITHNMKQALELGNRTLLMADGNIVLDVGGEERSRLSVEDLLARFKAGTGHDLDNDRILLSD